MTTATPAPVRLSGWRMLTVLALACAAAVVAGLAAARIMAVLTPDAAADPHRLAVVVVAVVYLAIALTLLAGLGRNGGQRRFWLALTSTDGRSLKLGATVWAGAYVASMLLYAGTSPLGLTPGDALDVLLAVGADNGRLAGASPALAALILLRIAILAPLAEELLFRGALFTWLRQRLAASWTIALTAVGFALIHQAPAMLPLAAVVGVAAGLVRERTGSVTVPLILHAAQNVAVVALSFALTGWEASSLAFAAAVASPPW